MDSRDSVTPWHFCQEHKSRAIRGDGAKEAPYFRTKNYVPEFEGGIRPNGDSAGCATYAYDMSYSKIVDGVLNPCNREQDEKIMLITMRGRWMEYIRNIDLVHVSEIMRFEGRLLGYPAVHMVVRLDDPMGYVSAELTRNENTVGVLTFDWKGSKRHTPEEFSNWMRSDSFTVSI